MSDNTEGQIVESVNSIDQSGFEQNLFFNITKPLNATPSRKLKTLSLSDKIRLLNEVDKGNRKKKDIAKEFGIPASTLSTIYKSRERLQEFAEVTMDSNRKRMKRAKHPDVEEETLKWLSSIQHFNVPISGTLIREKAQWFATLMGYKDFQASVGWLEKFRSRYLFIAKSLQKKASCTLSESDFHKCINEIFPRIMKEYKADNIFCVSETCLYYKCLLDKKRMGKCDYFSEDQIKEWVTLLIATNMSGSEKQPLLLIGNLQNPVCFSHFKSFPMEYKYSKTAFMTAEIFEEWLRKLDDKLFFESRKIAMIINDSPSHKKIENLKAIKLYNIPSDLTSLIQPMSNGIIKNLKYYYRKNIVLKFISSLNKTQTRKASLLDCMRDIYLAWESVSPSVITNSFKKAGFPINSNAQNTTTTPQPDTDSDSVQKDWKKLQEMSCIPHDMTFESYVNIDENFMLLNDMSDSEIFNELLAEKIAEQEGEDSKPLRVPVLNEALSATESLQSFIESRDNVPNSVFQAIAHIQQFMLNDSSTNEHSSSSG